MKFIKSKDRTQVEFLCLDEQIEHNNDVRLIDFFVQSVALADAGFKMDFIENGKNILLVLSNASGIFTIS